METFKPNPSLLGRAALLATACLVIPLNAGETRGASGIANAELSKRSSAIQEAQILLQKGDEAYTVGNYGDAVAAYGGARELIPDAPISAELREAATQRYAQASVEYARGLVRAGDLAGAKAAVDQVLAPSVAPNHPAATAYRDQLDDPIRTNPALTKKHGQDIDAVRRLLYTAEGAYDLGKFDEAKRTYESVIRIDPTNSAARRGMERVAQARTNYSKSAYDHTRAEMLAEVDSGWETALSPLEMDPGMASPGFSEIAGEVVRVKAKLDNIVIPTFAVDQASLDEAIDLLRVRAAENDTTETDPALKGVNITVNLGDTNSAAAQGIRDQRFDLRLSHVPVSQILKHITNITQTSFTTDDFAVKIVPSGSSSNEMVIRNYRVPPDFISSISTGSGSSTTESDPFAPTPSGGLLATRLGAQEALAQQGVSFPEGASANYTPKASLLRVVNTESNQEFISQLVETMTNAEPVMISVAVTMIKVEKSDLEELGFDWLLDNFGFGGSAWIPGAEKYNLSGGSVGNGRPLDDVALAPNDVTRRPITAGNRSGDYALRDSSIDGLILNPGGRQIRESAPGVIAVRGAIDDTTVTAVMRGLAQKGGIDVMARPSVVTRSGQATSIASVREFPYPTEYEPPELPNSTGDEFGGGGGGATPVTPATPTAFKWEDVGITLDVVPVVGEDKRYVNVSIKPDFSEFDGFVNYGSPINTTQQGVLGPSTVEVTRNAILQPVFSHKRMDDNVDVLDGANLVVGGLIQDRIQMVDDQVPILGSIPIVGRLFQSSVKKKTSTAIIFTLRVEVMDPTGRRFHGQ